MEVGGGLGGGGGGGGGMGRMGGEFSGQAEKRHCDIITMNYPFVRLSLFPLMVASLH